MDEDLGNTTLEDQFIHTENFILLDGQRRIRGIYNGLNPDSVRSLIADIKLLSTTGNDGKWARSLVGGSPG